MLLSAVSVLVVAQSSSEIPEGLTNNPVFRKLKFHKNTARMMGTECGDLCTLMTTSRWVLLGMRNVSGKVCTYYVQ